MNFWAPAWTLSPPVWIYNKGKVNSNPAFGQHVKRQHVKIVMKRLLIWLIIFLIPSTSFAHGGRTNKDGCHHNRKTGEYHCHGKKRTTPSPGSPSSTYDRKQFGNWIDADGDCQNTRHEVLIEESRIPVTFKTSRQCIVISGEWHDPYTGRLFTNPSLLDVDHVVPLKEAFDSGADEWSRQKKIRFANDLENKNHLIAVYRSANRSKGAKDPARWLPPNTAYHQEYVTIWREIKKAWRLSLDSLEASVIQRILKE